MRTQIFTEKADYIYANHSFQGCQRPMFRALLPDLADIPESGQAG